MIDLISAGFWLAGATLALLAAVGVLRMPDLFLRMQASTKASTLGLGCLLIGTALQLSDIGSVMRAASTGQQAYLDVAIVIALVSFVGTVAYARYIEREDVR